MLKHRDRVALIEESIKAQRRIMRSRAASPGERLRASRAIVAAVKALDLLVRGDPEEHQCCVLDLSGKDDAR